MDTGAIAWEAVGLEAAEVLGRYVRIDTTNPPGNEAEAARFLSDVLSNEGIESAIHETAPGRANLVARLGSADASAGGDAAQQPLLLLHHMDVVPPEASGWSVPPFGGEQRDGYVWGRGAIDDKGLGTVHLMALILLKRLGIALKRDVVLMAVADEEEGGALGAQWMIENRWPDIACEYVWDEGGAGSEGMVGASPIFAVSVSEKRSLVVRVTAVGQGGHGSVASGTAVELLVRALGAVHGYRAPIRFNEVTRQFFQRIARSQSFPASWLTRHAGHLLVKPLVAGRLSRIPAINAMLRDTVTPTIVKAGQKANVAPDLAEATLDARLLPDTDVEAFLDVLRRTINDEDVAIEAAAELPAVAPPSPADSAMFRAFERAVDTHVPGAITAPIQTPVATDSRFFRPKGVKAYGLIPALLTQEDLNTVHGADERMSVKNLTLGIRIAVDVLVELCA